MTRRIYVHYYILIIQTIFLGINFNKDKNKKDKNKIVYIEIIIPGSCLYNLIDLFKKTENQLWDYKNLKNLHYNETSKLKITVDQPMLTEIEFSENWNNYFNKTYQYFQNKNIDCKFFFFNWPGKRTTKHFFFSAKILYFEIKTLLLKLKEEYSQIKINIIGYSHGGNIGTLITHWIKENQDSDITIETLYLLGTPIGQTTLNHINLKNNNNQFIINKVINLYNPEDWVQTFDKNFDFFCQQTIPTTRKNIKNIKVMENNHDFHNKISQNFFKKGYSLHMFYLEEEFLCQEFFNIKNKLL